MSFSLGADALWCAAQQVAARLDVVRESCDQRESRSYPESGHDQLTEAFHSFIFPPSNSTGAATRSFPVSMVSPISSTNASNLLRPPDVLAVEALAIKQAIPGQVNSRLFELARVLVGFDHAASTIVNLVYCAMSSTAMLRVVDCVPGVEIPQSG